MSLKRRLATSGLLLLLGPLVAVAVAFADADGRFVVWQVLAPPPEPPVSIIAAANGLWITTASGVRYHYQPAHRDYSCSQDCWVVEPDAGPDLSHPALQPVERCSRVPSLPYAITIDAVCEAWGPGASLTAFALRGDGTLYYWNHKLSEGTSLELLYSPCLGLALGLLSAMVLLWVTAQPAAT